MAPKSQSSSGTLKLTWFKSPVGHLWCWCWCTQLGPAQGLDSTGCLCSRAPLWKLSCPCQLQQPTLPTANVSHVGRSLNIMPKCNTGPDAIKKKIKSCWCKHYAFTSPSLTSLLHSQQQAAISLVISSASSNVHLPVFNPLCSPFYHPMINPFPSTISQLPRSFPLSPNHIWLLDCSSLLSVNIFKVYLGLHRLFFPSR